MSPSFIQQRLLGFLFPLPFVLLKCCFLCYEKRRPVTSPPPPRKVTRTSRYSCYLAGPTKRFINTWWVNEAATLCCGNYKLTRAFNNAACNFNFISEMTEREREQCIPYGASSRVPKNKKKKKSIAAIIEQVTYVWRPHIQSPSHPRFISWVMRAINSLWLINLSLPDAAYLGYLWGTWPAVYCCFVLYISSHVSPPIPYTNNTLFKSMGLVLNAYI